jgi:hypothetical protein
MKMLIGVVGILVLLMALVLVLDNNWIDNPTTGTANFAIDLTYHLIVQ